jgi:hypothetical protein
MKKEKIAMIIIVLALLVFSGVQAVEISNLKKDIETGKISYSSGSSGNVNSGATTRGSSKPAYSGMVGGC